MKVLIYWFRNDLRLIDNPAFVKANSIADYVLPVFIHQSPRVQNNYGIERVGIQRQVFLRQSLESLQTQLQAFGSDLWEFVGEPEDVLSQLMMATGAQIVFCEQIEAPEEVEQCRRVRQKNICLEELWQSSMLAPQELPFDLQQMPDVFTQFRQAVEREKLKFAQPISTPTSLAPLPLILQDQYLPERAPAISVNAAPYCSGGEGAAQAHLKQYLERRLPDTYKQTRNQLIGRDYSSKFSPWLALGCISARDIAARLAEYEQEYGANDGTYWLWFELLWRDYFHFIHFKYGRSLYKARGLSKAAAPVFNSSRFGHWYQGTTGIDLVDGGMHELTQTGYLSNRMRQIVASYWIYELEGDWRAGAAWFESQLIDYDVYSNQGNWLYIAGRGTDPRGGRPFNIAKQAREYDPAGLYQQLWL